MKLQLLDGHAGSGSHLPRQHIDGTEGCEPLHRKQHGAIARHAAANQSCVATLGHHRHSSRSAHAQHRGHFLHRPGPHHGRGRASPLTEPVGLVGGAQVGVDQHMVCANDIAHGGYQQAAHRASVNDLGTCGKLLQKCIADPAARHVQGALNSHDSLGLVERPTTHAERGFHAVILGG